MLNAIIIEDEKPAMEVLVKMLGEISTGVNIKTRLHSVKESIEFITAHSDAGIIFSDVQLSDGLWFEILKQARPRIPVIFATGYDKFMMMAFENNGKDYLLEPITKSGIDKVLLKYIEPEAQSSHHDINAQAEKLVKFISNSKKARLIVKRGIENIPLRLEDIPLFYTENKVVYVIDRFSKKYICDKTLTELEEELENNTFFRAKRQYIIKY